MLNAAVGYLPGMVKDRPARMAVPEIPLALLSAETEHPIRLAIEDSESPCLMT